MMFSQITLKGWLKENAPGGWIDDLRKENAALKAQIADEELAFNHANETIGKLEADLQEARKAALEEAARIADKIGEQAADGSDSLSRRWARRRWRGWNDMQCHRANGCFKVASEIRKSISAPGRGQQHGECPACTILDQSLERGEGTHLEGTRQHPKGQEEGK